MDTDDDMPLFHSTSNARRVDYSDSEDDTLLSSTLDHDGFEGLNVSDKIKNIMSIDNFYMDTTFDDENNALFEMPESLKNRKPASTSEETENKFKNFPFNKPEPEPAPQKKKRASAKKPKEKKRKRDIGKKKQAPKDIMERPANHERTAAFLKELAEEMVSSDDDEESGRLYRPKQKKTRKGRQSKSLQQVDENGEQLIRTTDILEDSSSSEEDEKRMTKQNQLEMYRETDRLRREANISIKPTFHKKSFNDLFNKLASRKRQTKQTPSSELTIKKPITKHEEFNDDLEIVGAPTNMLSPEKSKASVIPWSPVATSNSIHKKHNQQLRDRIAQHMYSRRKEMEEAAMSRGEYTSATDRAKRTLERERENELIYLEVNKHFSKNKSNHNDDDDDDDQDDGDYNQDEQEGYDDDIMDELSGQEDDEEEEEQDKEDQSSSTRKEHDGESDEEDDLATVAFKRWKRKPGKKSIFDDDDEEVDKPRVEPKKPEPKNSIATFFQNNTKTTPAIESNVSDENKPLSRLKQRNEPVEHEKQVQQQDDAMDIDDEASSNPEQRQVTFAPIPSKPQGPKPKSRFLEEEAEEEEDEHFGAGGPDADETEDLDQFEDDGLLVERNEETDNVDEAVLKEIYSEQMMEKDKNMIDRLMKDITGGGLRRQKAAAENGLMLDDFDIYDNDEDDLIAIRRAAAAKRRRMLFESGDVMERLASNPKTAAFAKAAQTVLDEESRVYLSDSEEEVEEVKYKSNSALVIEESDEEVDEEDDDDEDEDNEKEQVGEASSSAPIIIEENKMEYIELEEEDETSFTELDIKIQSMTRVNASPLASRNKPFFQSPGKMDRFTNLLGEGRLNFGGSNDTGGSRVGLGTALPKKDKGKKPERGFVPSKTDKESAKSRLSGAMSSRVDSFTS